MKFWLLRRFNDAQYFDYVKMAKEARIPNDKLDKLAKMVREEFPKDDMMFELHLLRVCSAINDGHLSLGDALMPKQVA